MIHKVTMVNRKSIVMSVTTAARLPWQT